MEKQTWNEHNTLDGCPLSLEGANENLRVKLKLRGGNEITLPMRYISWGRIQGDYEREVVEWQLESYQVVGGLKIDAVNLPLITKETKEFVLKTHDDTGLLDPDPVERLTQVDAKTNPKAIHGQSSLPLSLFSPLGTAYGCIGKLNGKLKYGLNNFIGTEVVASIYVDAIRRHLDKWMSGQEVDDADGVPHFAAILANVDILINAQAEGTLIDDRGLTTAYFAGIEKLTPMVKFLHDLHKDKNPKHYYLKDKEAKDGAKQD